MNIEKTKTYGVKNPGSDLVQALKSGGVKPVNGIPTLPVMIIRSPTVKQIQEMYKQNRKIHTDLLVIK